MKLFGMIMVQPKHIRRSFTMITIPKLSKQMEQLLGPVADQLGKESGFIKRERIFSGSSFARTLVFSWWQDPCATCAARTQTAHLLGACDAVQLLPQLSRSVSLHLLLTSCFACCLPVCVQRSKPTQSISQCCAALCVLRCAIAPSSSYPTN